jgi:hypothetical protein
VIPEKLKWDLLQKRWEFERHYTDVTALCIALLCKDSAASLPPQIFLIQASMFLLMRPPQLTIEKNPLTPPTGSSNC